jgi:hypothetical protein
LGNWIIVAVIYGCGAYLAIQLSDYICKDIERFADGPAPERMPVRFVIVGSVIIGVLAGLRLTDLLTIITIGFVLFAVIAAWNSDAKKGVIPDYFTLVPLVLVLLWPVLHRNLWPVFWAAAAFVPFGATSYISKGRGMGWGDSKLAALGGAVLLDQALIAYSAACLAAVAVAYLRRKRTEPIAFGPFLAASIAGSIALRLALPG